MTIARQTRDLDELLPSSVAERLRMFRREAERVLQGRVKNVVLFGSRARGEARRGSDYDVAVFVSDLANRRVTDHILSDLAYPHLLAGMHIVPVSVPEHFLDQATTGGLAASIQRDGIPVR